MDQSIKHEARETKLDASEYADRQAGSRHEASKRAGNQREQGTGDLGSFVDSHNEDISARLAP